MESNFFNRSIKNKIVAQFSIIIALFLILIIFSIGYLFLENTQEEARKNLENEAVLFQEKIEERLGYLINTTELLSKNTLMINALIDNDGKKKYLTPLANNFMDDKNVNYLNIVDFDGKVIFKTTELIPKYNESRYLRNALAMGYTSYHIDTKNNNLIVISPMKYYSTTQGALIASFELNKIVDKYLIHMKNEYINIYHKNKRIYSINFFDNEKYYSYTLEAREGSFFSKLGISLEVGASSSKYLSPIIDAITKLSIVSIILFIIGIFFSYLLASSITKPILKLYHRVKEDKYQDDYKTLGTNDELEVLSEEFYKKANSLYKSENLTQSVINGIQDLIFFKDKEFKYIGCNEAFLKFTGKEKVEDIIGKTDFDLFDEESASLFREMDIKMLEENTYRTNNEWVTYPDGRKVYLQAQKSPFIYEKQNVGVLGICRDITQLNKLQEEELEKQKILSEQSKMASMGEMIGNIAHQWRQPLSIISTAATGMKLKQEYEMLDSKDLIEELDVINKNAQYLSKTIDDFKNFIKGNRSKEKFNLSKTINSFLSLVEGSAKVHDIKILLNLDDNIEVDGYPNELIQCFINIFNNAKDALDEKDLDKKYILIETIKKEDFVLIKIKDNAGGIPQNIIEKIFEPYFTTKHQSQGTGLGLSMTFNLIVDGMKGSIEVNNVNFKQDEENYKGAEFTISLAL